MSALAPLLLFVVVGSAEAAAQTATCGSADPASADSKECAEAADATVASEDAGSDREAAPAPPAAEPATDEAREATSVEATRPGGPPMHAFFGPLIAFATGGVTLASAVVTATSGTATTWTLAGIVTGGVGVPVSAVITGATTGPQLPGSDITTILGWTTYLFAATVFTSSLFTVDNMQLNRILLTSALALVTLSAFSVGLEGMIVATQLRSSRPTPPRRRPAVAWFPSFGASPDIAGVLRPNVTLSGRF